MSDNRFIKLSSNNVNYFRSLECIVKLTCLVIASVSDKNVIDTMRLEAQFIDVAMDWEELLDHVG